MNGSKSVSPGPCKYILQYINIINEETTLGFDRSYRIFPPYRCNNCRWPVCNEKCQNGVTHQRECPILASHPHNNETEKQCGIYHLSKN